MLYGQVSPPDVFAHGLIFNLVEGRYPSCRTLADLVRTGVPLGQTVDDGVVTHRFARDDVPSGSTRYEVQLRVEPRVELLGYAVSVHAADTGRLLGRQTYRVSDWLESGDRRIPAAASIEGWKADNPDPAGPAPAASLVLYRREAFRVIAPEDVEPTTLDTPMPPGTRVHDARLNLSFTVGEPYLRLDGTLYELDAPLLGHPGDRLGALVRAARPHVASAAGPGQAAPPEVRTLRGGRWAAVLGALAVVVVAAIAFRAAGHRRGAG
jgi:hypothetical protein